MKANRCTGPRSSAGRKKADRRGARMLTFLEKVTIDEQRRYRAIIEPCQCGKPMVVEKLPHDFSKCDRTAAPTCSGIICFDEWAARCTSCGFDVCSPCVSYLQAPRGERAVRACEQEIRTASGQVRSGRAETRVQRVQGGDAGEGDRGGAENIGRRNGGRLCSQVQ